MTDTRGGAGSEAGRKAVLVTGGTRGLGRALVRGFVERGYRVYTTGRDENALRDVERESSGVAGSVIGLAADVTSIEDNARVASRISSDGSTLAAVIHNAGLLGKARTPLADYPPEVFRRVMDVNVFGPFDLTRQLLPCLAKDAAVIFVSSGASTAPRAGWGAYSVSKMAMDCVAGIFARELESVRVYVVDPGAMRTGMRADAYPEEDPRTLNSPEARVPAFIRLVEERVAASGARVIAQDLAR